MQAAMLPDYNRITRSRGARHGGAGAKEGAEGTRGAKWTALVNDDAEGWQNDAEDGDGAAMVRLAARVNRKTSFRCLKTIPKRGIDLVFAKTQRSLPI